jgi:hypothetical protein
VNKTTEEKKQNKKINQQLLPQKTYQ